MKVKIRKENYVVPEYVYEKNKKYIGPSIGEQLVKRDSHGYALSAIILTLIPTSVKRA
jgi:phage baseplate assembly protein gpV